jgi:hypothetical protein
MIKRVKRGKGTALWPGVLAEKSFDLSALFWSGQIEIIRFPSLLDPFLQYSFFLNCLPDDGIFIFWDCMESANCLPDDGIFIFWDCLESANCLPDDSIFIFRDCLESA